MKTPKRDYKLPPSLTRTDISDYFEPEYHAQEARWKRKNRVKQLKRTIERLSRENFYMKIDLHIPTNISYEEYHARRVDFTEKKPEPEYYD